MRFSLWCANLLRCIFRFQAALVDRVSRVQKNKTVVYVFTCWARYDLVVVRFGVWCSNHLIGSFRFHSTLGLTLTLTLSVPAAAALPRASRLFAARVSPLFWCVQESIIPFLPPPILIIHTTAILLRDFCAIYDLPPALPLYAIQYTILVMPISCKEPTCSGGSAHGVAIGRSSGVTPRFYAIHHTILVMAISCKGQNRVKGVRINP